MEVKINVKIEVANFDKIIEKLSQFIQQTNYTNMLSTNEKVKEEQISNIELATNIEPSQNIDIVKLREKIGQLSMSGKVLQVKQLLEKYNVKKLSDVEPKHYESLYKDITKQLN